ncbi:hypothetical protein VN97_g4104 [Penicillium thymicola]|uniref:Uncharacterized protein n=1 Tax=Penicillium thymicola TaxID=293382 RepID=A0AAI9TLB4_PENTH|nr:hypothetical protein VN97_g4104 [Penicillium thymicola]
MGGFAELSIIRSHGLVVKRMTSNHEILGSTPSVSIFCLFFLTTYVEKSSQGHYMPTIIVGKKAKNAHTRSRTEDLMITSHALYH